MPEGQGVHGHCCHLGTWYRADPEGEQCPRGTSVVSAAKPGQGEKGLLDRNNRKSVWPEVPWTEAWGGQQVGSAVRSLRQVEREGGCSECRPSVQSPLQPEPHGAACPEAGGRSPPLVQTGSQGTSRHVRPLAAALPTRGTEQGPWELLSGMATLWSSGQWDDRSLEFCGVLSGVD